jgi:hypothetical protein
VGCGEGDGAGDDGAGCIDWGGWGIMVVEGDFDAGPLGGEDPLGYE